MAILLSELLVKIGADISDYTSGIDGAISKLGDAESVFSSAGMAMSAALTVPLAAIGAAAMEASSQIKEGFNAIIVQTGAVGTQLDGLKGSFSNVFAGVPESAKSVGDAIAQISQRLGLAGPALDSLSTQFLNLAHITGGTVQPLVESTTRAFNAFKIATDQQGASLDYLFSVFQHTGATVQSLSEGLTQYGAQFRTLGLDFQQSAALLGEFEKEGVNTQAAMPGLRTALKLLPADVVNSGNGFQTLIDYIKTASTDADGLAFSLQVFGNRGGASMFDAIKSGAVDAQNLATAFASAGAS